MALHFNTLIVDKIKKETPDCVSIAFSIPDDLKKAFSYKAGQYLTLKTQLNGTEVRRSYSLCTAPHENEWKVAVKKVPDGLFSSYANDELKPGDQLEVMNPTGNFICDFNPENKKNYVAFAAGSGITPVISLIKSCLETEKDSTFTLFYGNKTSSDIIFREELEAIKNLNLERFRLFHIFSQELETSPIFSGRIDSRKLKTFCKQLIDLSKIDEIFLCGPEEMIFSLKESLENNDFDPGKIHFELFTTPDTIKSQTDKADNKVGFSSKSSCKVTLKLDDNTLDFELDYDGASILDQALSLGADLPFACKGGVCSTCRAKLIEGEVEMDVNYSLEPYELDMGFILTCQSHPRSEKLFVDYDHS